MPPSPLATSSGTGRLSLCEPRTIAKPPSPGAWSHSCTLAASSVVHIWPPTHRYWSSGLNWPAGTPSAPEMGPPCSAKPSELDDCAMTSGWWSRRKPSPHRAV
eukprot:scaffold12591_cov102-Isochrysis_galbana.AAC.2